MTIVKGFTLVPETKSKAYLAWLHALACLVCGCRGIQAHHVRRHGERKDDHRAVPLCWEHHLWDSPVGVHRLGRTGFQARFGIDFEAVIVRLNAEWACS